MRPGHVKPGEPPRYPVTLLALRTACAASQKFGMGGWVKTDEIDAEKVDRSAARLHMLVRTGYVTARKQGNGPKSPLYWRITDKGRQACAEIDAAAAARDARA